MAASHKHTANRQPVLWILITTGLDTTYVAKGYDMVHQQGFKAYILHSDPHNTLPSKTHIQALLTL